MKKKEKVVAIVNKEEISPITEVKGEIATNKAPQEKKSDILRSKSLKKKTKELNDLKETQKELKKRIKEKEEQYRMLFQGESTIVNWINKIFKKTENGSSLDESIIKEVLFMENELRETVGVLKEIKKLIKDL